MSKDDNFLLSEDISYAFTEDAENLTWLRQWLWSEGRFAAPQLIEAVVFFTCELQDGIRRENGLQPEPALNLQKWDGETVGHCIFTYHGKVCGKQFPRGNRNKRRHHCAEHLMVQVKHGLPEIGEVLEAVN